MAQSAPFRMDCHIVFSFPNWFFCLWGALCACRPHEFAPIMESLRYGRHAGSEGANVRFEQRAYLCALVDFHKKVLKFFLLL